MARPINADAEGTRRRILESALAMFAERGLGASPVREIAGRAGVSLAMVHHYFGNKDGLYDACVDSMYEEIARLREHVAAELAGADLSDVPAIVERTLRAGFAFAREHQPAMRLMLRSVVESGELDAERRHRFQLPFLAQASELLESATGQPRDELRLALQSVVFLLARYAISTDDELARVTGKSPAGALAAAEDHLVSVARRLLGFVS